MSHRLLKPYYIPLSVFATCPSPASKVLKSGGVTPGVTPGLQAAAAAAFGNISPGGQSVAPLMGSSKAIAPAAGAAVAVAHVPPPAVAVQEYIPAAALQPWEFIPAAGVKRKLSFEPPSGSSYQAALEVQARYKRSRTAGHTAVIAPTPAFPTCGNVNNPYGGPRYQGPTIMPVGPPSQGPTTLPVGPPSQGPTTLPVGPPSQGPTTLPVGPPCAVVGPRYQHVGQVGLPLGPHCAPLRQPFYLPGARHPPMGAPMGPPVEFLAGPPHGF